MEGGTHSRTSERSCSSDDSVQTWNNTVQIPIAPAEQGAIRMVVLHVLHQDTDDTSCARSDTKGRDEHTCGKLQCTSVTLFCMHRTQTYPNTKSDDRQPSLHQQRNQQRLDNRPSRRQRARIHNTQPRVMSPTNLALGKKVVHELWASHSGEGVGEAQYGGEEGDEKDLKNGVALE